GVAAASALVGAVACGLALLPRSSCEKGESSSGLRGACRCSRLRARVARPPKGGRHPSKAGAHSRPGILNSSPAGIKPKVELLRTPLGAAAPRTQPLGRVRSRQARAPTSYLSLETHRVDAGVANAAPLGALLIGGRTGHAKRRTMAAPDSRW